MALTSSPETTAHGDGDAPPPPASPKDHWSVDDGFYQEDVPLRVFLHRNYEIGMHTHDFVEVNVVMKGRGRHYMESTSFPVRRGDVFVIPPSVPHAYRQERALDVFHLLLHPRFVAAHGLRLRALPGFLLLFTVEPYFRKETSFRYGLHIEDEAFRTANTLIEQLAADRDLPDPPRAFAAENLGLYLLAFLCQRYAEQHPAADEPPGKVHAQTRALQAALDLIARRYGEKLSLADLAEAAHMERSYFCRLFREATGLTPMEHLNQVRIHEAQRLLRETDRSVTEIGYAVGFYDTSHFCRVFAKTAGASPGRYREAHGPR